MMMKGEIVALTVDHYQGKRGQVTQHILTLLDRGEGPRMKNTLDFVLTEEQATKFPVHENGKLQGKAIEVAIEDLRAGFGGRMRAVGQVVNFKL